MAVKVGGGACGGGGVMEKFRRIVRTVFFVVTMILSLLTAASSLPLIVALGDLLVPCVLVTSFSCLSCYSVKDHFRRYGFKTSLTDIPLVSVVRSLVIVCVYSICDGASLSHGPYLGTVTLSSVLSILLLSVKACIFSVNSQIEADASSSLARKRLHLKKSWGMPVLFLSSVVFALGHTVVAYQTRYRARRKLLYHHRVDSESVLSRKNVFSGFQKIPRSLTPSAGKTPKNDSEIRRKHYGSARDEGKLPIRLLADIDSLFVSCKGLTLHYKLGVPGSPPRSLSSTIFLEPRSIGSTPAAAIGRVKHEWRSTSVLSETHHSLHRSFSNQFPSSSLCTPLLDGSATTPAISEEMPVFSLDVGDEVTTKFNCHNLDPKLGGNGQLGIVLIHGFGGGVFQWRHVMGVLARETGCSVAAFDRPGWGLTSRPRHHEWEEKNIGNPYKLETQVELLLSFCSIMGFSSVVLIGHDDGGLLALMAVERAKALKNSIQITIKGVVLLSVSLSRDVVPSFARILLRTSLGKKHLIRSLLRTEITQVVNRRAWYDASKLTTEVLSLYKAPLCIEGWDEALYEIGRLSSETILSPQSSSALLKSVEDLPVLVIAGAEDALVSPKSTQAMASKLVNSRLVLISGCGHLPHEECPKALLAAISPFVSRLTSQPNLHSSS